VQVSNGIQLRVKGKVQGVGFRPYVWQLAHQQQLYGDVCNDGEGVLIRLLAMQISLNLANYYNNTALL